MKTKRYIPKINEIFTAITRDGKNREAPGAPFKCTKILAYGVDAVELDNPENGREFHFEVFRLVKVDL